MPGRPIRLVFVCAEDWFFASHFRPLVAAAHALGDVRLTLIGRLGAGGAGLEALGLDLVPFDFDRRNLRLVPALAQTWRLRRLLRRERADIVHLIALKPIVIGGLALTGLSGGQVYHLVGQGLAAVARSMRVGLARRLALRLLARFLARPGSRLVVENSDDLDTVARHGRVAPERVAIFGGAGVDPEHFRELPAPDNTPARIAFVGRMVWSKGVDVLLAAHQRLVAAGRPVDLHLFGAPDPGNPNSIDEASLRAWGGRAHVAWHGVSRDVREVWREADIAVVPSRGGEGLPRALLEAAACGRPLIVTDVPGCRRFVRDGVEGLVVPPDDAAALADAIGRLAGDAALRRRMGRAARARLLDGFTEAHVRAAATALYAGLIDGPGLKGDAPAP